MVRFRKPAALARVGGVVLALLLMAPTVDSAGARTGAYVVGGVSGRADRTAIARTGAGIEAVRGRTVIVRATRRERRRIARRGFRIRPLARAADFPSADSAYHDYSETVAELNAVASARPATVRLFSIGSSFEGRSLIGARVSNDSADRTDEPGVLLVAHHHAREHLTVEVALSLLHLFAESTDQTVRSLVASRQIYILPTLNPDGGEYDIASGSYRFWRKNRQPIPGSFEIGTDLNRNYSYRWGCCGGSSADPASETYRGPSPFFAPETAALRAFVDSHPNIRTAISYHSYGGLVLYPYGYTYADQPPDMTQVDHRTFVQIAREMARTTGYRAQQASDLYITDGDFDDWMYGAKRMYAFTIELGGRSFYPGPSLIATETARNHAAAIYVAQLADCPTRAVGVACPVAPSVRSPSAGAGPTLPGSSPRPARTITGTGGDDTLVGTPGNDVIRCGAGDDRVRGGGGDDVIRCGAGHDRVSGGAGNDRVEGGSGNDRLSGDAGRDTLIGGRGNDRLSGGRGNDRLLGNGGRDRLFGGRGRDRLAGGSGRDRTVQ